MVDDVADEPRIGERRCWRRSATSSTEAAGGAEAVEAAAEPPFDLILMDLQMPGMDGLAATRAIRAASALNRATPIVALSANILPEPPARPVSRPA